MRPLTIGLCQVCSQGVTRIATSLRDGPQTHPATVHIDEGKKIYDHEASL